ncbi:MAG TPA: manganese efflux pump [Bacillota bacterium]|nr:manganese efflux pump [Bacillota bacterium]
MDWRLVAIVLSLGLDTFAVSVGLGLGGTMTLRRRMVVALAFAAAEAAMPLIGVAAGLLLGHFIGGWGNVVAGLVLVVLGIHMLRETEGGIEGGMPGGSLFMAALAISTDEVAAGLSLGALGLPVGLTSLLVGIQAFALTLLGVAVGRAVGERIREGAERLGAVVLMALGVLILIQEVPRVLR